MARILITGGAGFIGSNLVADLVRKGNEVIVVDTMETGNVELLRGLDVEVYRMGAHEFYERGDWREGGIDGIFHLGKPSASPMYRSDRNRIVELVRGTIAMLEIARELDVKVVSAGTSSVYNGLSPPHREDMPVQPTDFYTEARLFEERLSRVYELLYGVRWNELRFFSVYGPREEHKGKYANLITQAMWAGMRGEEFVIYGDGTQRRDFVYVMDVVDALERAMESERNGVYNVGTGRSTPLNDAVDLVETITGMRIRRKYVPNPVKNYVMVTEAYVENARRDLGFSARTSLEDGIRQAYEYYRNLGRLP
ncbi:MAG: NAD-dependent epimerase/dehydratase family protein [Conexivisphaera sp.]